MDGRCRRSPHRGHYWVEEIPESDDWACRWCGMIRHFNHERAEKMQLSETAIRVSEYASQQWFYQQLNRWSWDPLADDRLKLDANAYLHLAPS
jgi:hypothetical protein